MVSDKKDGRVTKNLYGAEVCDIDVDNQNRIVRLLLCTREGEYIDIDTKGDIYDPYAIMLATGTRPKYKK